MIKVFCDACGCEITDEMYKIADINKIIHNDERTSNRILKGFQLCEKCVGKIENMMVAKMKDEKDCRICKYFINGNVDKYCGFDGRINGGWGCCFKDQFVLKEKYR